MEVEDAAATNIEEESYILLASDERSKPLA